jgi:hypothetical protein
MRSTIDDVLEFIKENDVKFIRLSFCDLFGNLRNISIMPDELPRAFEHGIPFDTDVCPSKLTHAYTDIETDKIRNGCYKILSAQKNRDGLYELNIGDITLIRALVNEGQEEKYVYNIAEGAKIRIPLAKEE